MATGEARAPGMAEKDICIMHLVKWLGYPKKFNSWVPASQINLIS